MITLTGHDDEILDSCFDYTGKLIATASADGSHPFIHLICGGICVCLINMYDSILLIISLESSYDRNSICVISVMSMYVATAHLYHIPDNHMWCCAMPASAP